jgi:hypothetical protein
MVVLDRKSSLAGQHHILIRHIKELLVSAQHLVSHPDHQLVGPSIGINFFEQ